MFHSNKEISTVIQNLRRRNMNGYHVENTRELTELLNKLICDGSIVGSGDSVTMEQLGVFSYLQNRRIIFLDKHKEGLTADQKRNIYLRNFDADILVSGCNALTLKGEIINIDGNGSRVAPMIYGPRKVILIVGINKLAKNKEEAFQRARHVAAVLDAKRLRKDTPCTKSDKCYDCYNKERICNSFVCIAHQFDETRIHVILVSGEYGF